MKTIIGKKLGMTQVFDSAGDVVQVTAVEAGPCTIVQIKSEENEGYNSVQLAFGKKLRTPSKALAGHFKKSNVDPVKVLREVRVDDTKEFSAGQQILADIFKEGDCIDVVGTSKGKGYAGVIKRHNFSGGPATHGSRFHRAVGSVGTRHPQRTVKGRKNAGHMGDERVTVQCLHVQSVVPEKNLILIKGAVPGPRGGIVKIQEAVKS